MYGLLIWISQRAPDLGFPEHLPATDCQPHPPVHLGDFGFYPVLISTLILCELCLQHAMDHGLEHLVKMENTAKKVYYHSQHLYKSLDSKIVLMINCRGKK